MADNMTDDRNDADAIERDVRRTQDAMGETVDRLEEKLNPRDISREVMGDDGADAAREALDVTRQNPIPVALIAVGLIWLLASTRSPAINRLTERITGKRRGGDRDRSGLRPHSAEPAPIGPSGRGATGDADKAELRPRSAEPAPIGPPPSTGDDFDRRPVKSDRF